MGRDTTFLHVALDLSRSSRPPDSVGDIVQVVCSKEAPAPRLARAGAQLEIQGTIESSRTRSGQASVLALVVTLICPPPAGASGVGPSPSFCGSYGSSLCKAWSKASSCPDGAACKFRHAFASEDEEAKAVALSLRSAANRAADDFALAAAEAEDAGDHVKAHKGARHAVFATWILETYGAAALASKSGVVDVAGGKGLLSLELAFLAEVPCTVLDPRCARPGASELRRLRKRCSAKASSKNSDVGNEGVRNDRFAESHVSYMQAALPDGSDVDTGQYVDGDEASSLVANASLLIGLHSDEATEAIVDAALHHGVHFAVVPCCAFPSRFPHRTLENGDPVASTAQFLRYLKAKAPEGLIRQAWLPFEGRNAVLYTS